MSQSVRGVEITMIANSALDTTTSEYMGVRVAGNNLVDLVNTTTNFCIGILQNKPASGAAALVRIGGTSKAYAATAVTAGDVLTIVNDGTMNPITAGLATTTVNSSIVGVALEGVAKSGLFEMALFPYRGNTKGS